MQGARKFKIPLETFALIPYYYGDINLEFANTF